MNLEFEINQLQQFPQDYLEGELLRLFRSFRDPIIRVILQNVLGRLRKDDPGDTNVFSEGNTYDDFFRENFRELLIDPAQIAEAESWFQWLQRADDLLDSFGIVAEAEELSHLNERLLEVRSAVTPNTERDITFWRDPIKALSEEASEAKIIYYNHYGFEEDEALKKIPNGWGFLLDWLDTMGHQGFKSWVFGNAGLYLEQIHSMLKKSQSPLSGDEIIRIIRQYLNGNEPELLSELLGLSPLELPALRGAIDFWKSVWQLKRKHNANIQLYWGLARELVLLSHGTNSDQTILRAIKTDNLKGKAADFSHWLSGTQLPLIFIGDVHTVAPLFIAHRFFGEGSRLGPLNDTNLKNLTRVLEVKHAKSKRDYELESFMLSPAIRYAAHQIGQTERWGWGQKRTSNVPIAGNQRMQELMASEDPMSLTVSEVSPDMTALIFTGDDDSDSEEEEMPEEFDFDRQKSPKEGSPLLPALPRSEAHSTPPAASLRVGAESKGKVPSVSRAEARKIKPEAGRKKREGRSKSMAVRDIALALSPGTRKKVDSNSVGEIIEKYRVDKKELRSELRAQADAIQYTAQQAAMNLLDAQSTNYVESSLAIAAVIPKELEGDREAIGYFLEGYFDGLDRSVGEILIDGKIPEAYHEKLSDQGISERADLNILRSTVLKTGKQDSVPVALFAEHTDDTKIHSMFTPVFINDMARLIKKLSQDPDAPQKLRWLGKLTSRTEIYLADLSQVARLKDDPKALKGELLKRLGLEGYELVTIAQKGLNSGYGINAVLAEKVYSALVRRAIEAAA